MKKVKLASLALTLTSLTFILFSCESKDGGKATQVLIDSLNKQILVLSTTQKTIESNKKLVSDCTQELWGDKDIRAIDKYLGDTYIQHNPALPDGKEALRTACADWFKVAPKTKIDIQHLSADGDLVYVHTKEKSGDKTVSIIAIYRIANGKIVEHWDVAQDVPEKSANPHPMF